jgi:hypothetical protein
LDKFSETFIDGSRAGQQRKEGRQEVRGEEGENEEVS